MFIGSHCPAFWFKLRRSDMKLGIHPEACSRRPAQPGAETCRSQRSLEDPWIDFE